MFGSDQLLAIAVVVIWWFVFGMSGAALVQKTNSLPDLSEDRNTPPLVIISLLGPVGLLAGIMIWLDNKSRENVRKA